MNSGGVLGLNDTTVQTIIGQCDFMDLFFMSTCSPEAKEKIKTHQKLVTGHQSDMFLEYPTKIFSTSTSDFGWEFYPTSDAIKFSNLLPQTIGDLSVMAQRENDGDTMIVVAEDRELAFLKVIEETKEVFDLRYLELYIKTQEPMPHLERFLTSDCLKDVVHLSTDHGPVSDDTMQLLVSYQKRLEAASNKKKRILSLVNVPPVDFKPSALPPKLTIAGNWMTQQHIVNFAPCRHLTVSNGDQLTAADVSECLRFWLHEDTIDWRHVEIRLSKQHNFDRERIVREAGGKIVDGPSGHPESVVMKRKDGRTVKFHIKNRVDFVQMFFLVLKGF